MNNQIEIDFSVIEKEVRRITKVKKISNASSKKMSDDLLIIDHKRILNQKPPKSLIKINKQYGNKYIPLQVVEQMLLAIFKSYDIVIPFQPVLMEGQIITVVDIKVENPITNRVQTYSGISCIPLIAANNDMQKWNHRNIPSGKSFAILNASKEIGQIFRAEADDYSDVMRDYFVDKQEAEVDKNMINRLKKMIASSKTLASLKKKHPKIHEMKNDELDLLYRKKMETLKK